MSKQDCFIGVRFTEEEMKQINKFIELKNLSYNKFLRQAVFSYLNNIETVKDKIDFTRINSNIKEFEKILPNLIRNIHKLYKEFDEFKLNKDTYLIT